MDSLLQSEIYPVLLGYSRAALRILRKHTGAQIRLLSATRPLSVRFDRRILWQRVRPELADELLLMILEDLECESGTRLPRLLIGEKRYLPFLARNRAALERRFVLRDLTQLREGEYGPA